MTDVAAAPETAAPAVAAPEAPAAPAPATPALPALPPQLAAKREARQGMRESGDIQKATEQVQNAIDARRASREAATAPAETAEAAPIVDATGRLHAPESGKFVAKEGVGDDAAQQTEAAADEVAAEGTEETPAVGSEEGAAVEGEVTDADAAEVASGVVVDVPEGHLIRKSGRAAFTVADETEARDLRAVLNQTGARRQDVETLTTRVSELEQQNADYRRRDIEREAHDAATQEWMAKPEYQQLREQYFEIKDTQGQEAASRFWRGAQADLQPLVDREIKVRQEVVQRETEQRIRTAWHGEARQRTEILPESIRTLSQFPQWFSEELASFEALADGGHLDAQIAAIPETDRAQWLHDQFGVRFARRLRSEPAVVAAYKANGTQQTQESASDAVSKDQHEKAIAAAKKAGAEEARRAAATTRQAAPPNPLAGATSAGTPEAVSRAPEEPDFTQMTAHQIKRYHREQARKDARSLGVGT